MDANRLLIRIEGVSYAYPGGDPVLNDLCFSLREGEKIGLVGPNGSGKTTLFLLIMGLLKPFSGTVEIFGLKRREEKDFRDVRQRIGMLFQDADDQLFSPTVLEDVAFGPLNQGKSPRQAREIAIQTLADLGLQGFEDRVTHRLSGGEKKLVSLATVLAMRPRVLLLDEPTNGLDPETTLRIIDLLKRVEVAYLFISHNMDFLSQTTDRIYGMAGGRIIFEEETAVHTHIHTHGQGRIPHVHTDDHIDDHTDSSARRVKK